MLLVDEFPMKSIEWPCFSHLLNLRRFIMKKNIWLVLTAIVAMNTSSALFAEENETAATENRTATENEVATSDDSSDNSQDADSSGDLN